MAPIVLEARKRPDKIDPVICLSGQHRELLHPVMTHFGITPDLDLDLMRPGQSLADLTGRAIAAIDGIIERVKPDCVVAQGDTSTVVSASMAAFYRRVPFVHVEAGLRTGDLQAPWPEEFNRRVVSIATSIHCAPTARAAEALLAEGVSADRVRVTGNTVIDALLWTIGNEAAYPGPWREQYTMLGDRPMVLITGHRRENFGEGFQNICDAICRLAQKFPETHFVYPAHLNPMVQEPVNRLLGGRPNVHVCPPAFYPEFIWLANRSKLILTDSGGVQEEATFLRKPVLVMRERTERPEALDVGLARLVGTSVETIVAEVSALLAAPDPAADHASPYGDGLAATRIIDWMLERSWLGR